MDTKQQLSVVSCQLSVAKGSRRINGPRTTDDGQRTAFTLVELLVVITIIGILASLIVTAAIGAMGKAQDTRIKAEINQIDAALVEYKNKTTSFPPNCQVDDTDFTPNVGSDATIDESAVLNDLKRHLKQAFPRHQESEDLIRRLAGLASGGQQLAGGMTAGEAIVFWLGGFSSDPKYPISGEGGPSYPGTLASEDPIETRKWVFPFEVTRLAPRDSDKFFDGTDGRFITYADPRNSAVTRRINFWQYTPRNQEEPYLYFDTSRHPAAVLNGSNVLGPFDPPAASDLAGDLALHVHAFKKLSESASPGTPPVQFVNPDKFQVMHCGRDDEWDVDAFEQMSVHDVASTDPADYLTFPDGPFVGEMADTIVNFAEQTRIEDAQP